MQLLQFILFLVIVLQTPSLLPRKSLTRSETIEDEELAELAAAAAASNQEETSQETSSLEESVRTNLENHQTLLRLLDDGEKVRTTSLRQTLP